MRSSWFNVLVVIWSLCLGVPTAMAEDYPNDEVRLIDLFMKGVSGRLGPAREQEVAVELVSTGLEEAEFLEEFAAINRGEVSTPSPELIKILQRARDAWADVYLVAPPSVGNDGRFTALLTLGGQYDDAIVSWMEWQGADLEPQYAFEAARRLAVSNLEEAVRWELTGLLRLQYEALRCPDPSLGDMPGLWLPFSRTALIKAHSEDDFRRVFLATMKQASEDLDAFVPVEMAPWQPCVNSDLYNRDHELLRHRWSEAHKLLQLEMLASVKGERVPDRSTRIAEIYEWPHEYLKQQMDAFASDNVLFEHLNQAERAARLTLTDGEDLSCFTEDTEEAEGFVFMTEDEERTEFIGVALGNSGRVHTIAFRYSVADTDSWWKGPSSIPAFLDALAPGSFWGTYWEQGMSTKARDRAKEAAVRGDPPPAPRVESATARRHMMALRVDHEAQEMIVRLTARPQCQPGGR